MPFTLAHPALVMPFQKTQYRFSATGLIMGSMIPDFEFFFQLREVDNIGHHWYGMMLFDLPAGLLFCFLFHNLLRNRLLVNLPQYYRGRFLYVINFNWNAFASKNIMNVLVSLLIGIVSHIFLDGFTHSDGLFVLLVPALSVKLQLAAFEVPVYFLLQILFSMAGLLILTQAVHKMPGENNSQMKSEQNKYYWPSFLLIFLIILIIRITGWPQYNAFWSLILAVMGGFSYAWLMVSLLFKFYSLKKNSA